MNYIDQIASEICDICETDDGVSPDLRFTHVRLYRIYALLCILKGEATTAENVHQAWSVWILEDFPIHRCLVPYDELSDFDKVKDHLYRDAIIQVAKDHAPLRVAADYPTAHSQFNVTPRPGVDSLLCQCGHPKSDHQSYTISEGPTIYGACCYCGCTGYNPA